MRVAAMALFASLGRLKEIENVTLDDSLRFYRLQGRRI